MPAVDTLAHVMSVVPAFLSLVIIADAWVFNAYRSNICSRFGLTLILVYSCSYFMAQTYWILTDSGAEVGGGVDLVWSCVECLGFMALLKIQHRALLCSKARTSMRPYLAPPKTGDVHPAKNLPCTSCHLFQDNKCIKKHPCIPTEGCHG